MRYPLRSQELGSPAITAVLKACVGNECVITADIAGQMQELFGRIVRLEGARIAVTLQNPAQLAEGDSVQVKLSGDGVLWESLLLTRRSPSELLLSYPLWCSRADRRKTERVTLDLPCRYGLTTGNTTDWYSGTILDLGIRGIRLAGPTPVLAGQRFVLRLSVPGHPLPLLLHARSVWSSHLGSRYAMGAEVPHLSMQAEAVLRNSFGLTDLHNWPM